MSNFYAYTALFAGLNNILDLKSFGFYLSPSLADFKNFCMSNKARVKRYKKRGRR